MKKINNTSLVLLGIIPLLATTSRVYYAFWAALGFMTVLLLSVPAACLIFRLISGRIALFITTVFSAGLTTAVILLFRAYVPASEMVIGVCLSMLVGNVLVYNLIEASVEKTTSANIKIAVACSCGGAAVILVTAAVRELLQYGTLFSKFGGGEGVRIFSDWFNAVEFSGTPAGTLLIFGLIAAAAQKIAEKLRIDQRNRRLRLERILSGNHPGLVMDVQTGKIVRRSTAEMLERQRNKSEAGAENDEANAENTGEAEEEEEK